MPYNPPRTRNLFKKGEPFSFSRSKLEMFNKCPRCFVIDRVHGVDYPPGFPFNINTAVDTLLKREFDAYREQQKPHPLIIREGYDFVPFKHEKIDEWRENFVGVRTKYGNYEFSGAVDDIWVNKEGELIVVDYKSTAAAVPVTSIDKEYHSGYKRQLEFYQWLLKKNGFSVSEMAMIVYCTGDNSLPEFAGIMKFHTHLIAHRGDTSWIEPNIDRMISCLESEQLPSSGNDCDYCRYYESRNRMGG